MLDGHNLASPVRVPAIAQPTPITPHPTRAEAEAAVRTLVLLRDIPLHSTCEHHMAAITGTVDVAYLPNRYVVGISKLARVVDALGRRLQIQERLTAQIADSIERALQPRGIAVAVRASHGCMTTRGVHTQGTCMVTRDLRGDFREEPRRTEILAMLTGRG